MLCYSLTRIMLSLSIIQASLILLLLNRIKGGCNVNEAHHDKSNGKEFDRYNLVHVILFRK